MGIAYVTVKIKIAQTDSMNSNGVSVENYIYIHMIIITFWMLTKADMVIERVASKKYLINALKNKSSFIYLICF